MEYNITHLDPRAFIFLIIMIICLLLMRRQKIIFPILAVAFLLPMHLRIVVAGLDFTFLRIMLLIAVFRIIIRQEARPISMNILDKIVIIKSFIGILTYTILWGTFGAFINRLGQAYDIMAFYFIPRVLIRDFKELEETIKTLVLFTVPIALAMCIEFITGLNCFTIFGHISENPLIREGKIRAQGAFPHPILAGGFGACLLPFVIGLYWKGVIAKKKFLVIIISCLTIILTANSSGPFITFFGALFAIYLWRYKNYTKFVMWGTICLVFILQMIMKAPVWALMMRLGSSGHDYHRYMILDKTFRNFGEWWLLGTKSTSQWGHLKTMSDLANYYVRTAVDYGLIGLILLVLLLYFSFKTVGTVIVENTNSPEFQKFIWSLGASLFAHMILFFGISYKGANLLLLYLTIAVISSITMMSKDRTLKNKILKSVLDYGQALMA